uniref:Uncharacterized protein n=1 Tax=Arundo donax TaxID=35708 RepID=A0A0A9GWQ0_ARUDO
MYIAACVQEISKVLRRHAECLELEEFSVISVNPILLPALNDLLLEVYTMLRPKPVDYEQHSTLVDIFKKMTHKIFGTLSISCSCDC